MKNSLLFFLVALAVGSPGVLFATEMRLEDCPAAVQEVIRANTGDGRLDEIDFIAPRGVYEVEIDLGPQRDRRLLVAGSGEILETVEDIALPDAPEEIRSAIAAETKNGAILDDLERKTAGPAVTFLAEIDVAGGRDLYLEISDKGSILSRRDRD